MKSVDQQLTLFLIFYLKLHVVKPIVLSLFEEVGEAIVIAESSVYIIRNSFPVRNRPRVSLIHRRPLLWVKLPILFSLEEIYFLVARPDEGRVNVVRDSVKSFPDELWIARVRLAIRKSPVLVSLEEIGFSIQICEGGVQPS